MRGLILKLVIFVFALSMAFSCGDTKKKEFDLAVSKGVKAYHDKQYGRALTYYKEALRIYPNDAGVSAKVKELETLVKEQSAKDQTQKLIYEADSLFDAQDYETSQGKYREANLADPDNTYVQNRIAEIDNILLNQTGEGQNAFPQADNPYHIIVGSFASAENAENFRQKLHREGYQSIIVQRPNGYRAVSILRFQNIHEAFNRLAAEQEKFPEAWVLKY